jgi:FkbM family methyltransferase
MSLSRLKAMLPRSVKLRLREASYAGIVSDVASFSTFVALSRERPGTGSREQRSVRIRQLGSRPVTVRRGTTDATTIFTTFFHRFHRPPKEARLRDAPVILDLGANIGLTMADFATHYPRSRVIGVELDRDNADICRKNVAAWGDRCQLVEGAVWFEDGSLTYEVSPGSEDAFTVSPSEKTTRGVPVTARALSITTLLKEAGDPPVVDFVKMDIEGAESSVLEKNTEWASRVRSIKVELHHGYTHAMGIAALERMGFQAWRARDHVDSIEGVRA